MQKSPTQMCRASKYGALGRIRTFDRLVRSQVLYPAELRARKFFSTSNIMLIEMARSEGFEPSTAWFVARYSIQLSYERAVFSIIHNIQCFE